MLIGIDANEANVVNRVGIGRYALNVLWGIYHLRNRKLDFQIYLKNKPLPDLPKLKENWQYRVLAPSFFWTQIALPLYLAKTPDKPRLLYSTSHYAPVVSSTPATISIMDLSYEHYPELFKKTDLLKLKYWSRMSAKKAAKIITISQFSKSEIVKYYGINPDNIVVAYPGVDRQKFKPKKAFNKEDYLLFVGTLQPRKNISGLIVAFSLLKNKKNLRLMIVGQKGWLYQDFFKEVKKRGLESKIIFTDYVTENELISYYQSAVCFVLPSFYEGFGIPVVEAMACGCPVIASNSSSLPEIVGNAGLLVDPHRPASIAQAINKIYSDNNLRETLIKKGLNRSKAFNWQTTSQIVYTTIYKSI